MKRTNVFLGFICTLLLMLFAKSLAGEPGMNLNGAERDEILKIRQLVWDSYFSNDQPRLKALISEDFLTINPGEEHWQNRTEFLAGAQAFAQHHGKLVSLVFPRTEVRKFGDVAVLYSLVRITMESDSGRESLDCRSTEIFEKRHGQWVNAGAHVDSGQ